jgi:hypothetical protein
MCASYIVLRINSYCYLILNVSVTAYRIFCRYLNCLHISVFFPRKPSGRNHAEVRFEVFTAVTMKNAVFWDVAQCSSSVNRRFGGTYRLYLQGRKIRERGTNVSRWLPWRLRRFVPPKRRFTQELHGVTSQKKAFSIQKYLFLLLNFIILSHITHCHPVGNRRLKVLVDGNGINKWITCWFPGVYAIFRFAQYQDSRPVILSKEQSACPRLERKGSLSTFPRVAASELPLRNFQAKFQFLLTIIWKCEFTGQSWERINLREQINACLLNEMSERRLRFVKERISDSVYESSEFHLIYPSSKLFSACKYLWMMYVGLYIVTCPEFHD